MSWPMMRLKTEPGLSRMGNAKPALSATLPDPASDGLSDLLSMSDLRSTSAGFVVSTYAPPDFFLYVWLFGTMRLAPVSGVTSVENAALPLTSNRPIGISRFDPVAVGML